MAEIVVVGSLNMDLMVQVHRMPAPGETLAGGDLLMSPGGKGANQAAAAAKLGVRVAMVGRVGKDAFGPQLIDGQRRFGVNTSHIAIDDTASTGTAIIIVDGRGENSIVLSSGANGRVSPDDVDSAEPLLSEARFLLLQHEIPQPAVARAVHLARKNGVRVVLNPAPARDGIEDIVRLVDVLVPNETEASSLSGVDVTDISSAQRAAGKLLDMGPEVVIITLGADGALLATKERTVHQPAERVDVVDTTASGDAFVGGFVVAMLNGLDLGSAVRYANCCGAKTASKLGAQISLPSSQEVQQLFDRR